MPAMLEIQPYSDGHTKCEKNDGAPPPPEFDTIQFTL